MGYLSCRSFIPAVVVDLFYIFITYGIRQYTDYEGFGMTFIFISDNLFYFYLKTVFYFLKKVILPSLKPTSVVHRVVLFVDFTAN